MFLDYKFIFNSNTNDVFNSVNISCLRASKCNRVFWNCSQFKKSFSFSQNDAAAAATAAAATAAAAVDAIAAAVDAIAAANVATLHYGELY